MNVLPYFHVESYIKEILKKDISHEENKSAHIIMRNTDDTNIERI